VNRNLNATRFFMNDEHIVWTLADTLCPPRPGARHNFAAGISSLLHASTTYSSCPRTSGSRPSKDGASHVTDLDSRLVDDRTILRVRCY
jgi:hypothetical protein